MHHECPICQLEPFLEPLRHNAEGERRARKAGAVVRPCRQSATGEPEASSTPRDQLSCQPCIVRVLTLSVRRPKASAYS